MDEFIDQLIRDDRVCDIILPRMQVCVNLNESTARSTTVLFQPCVYLQKRHVLEENNDLAPKENYLEDDMDVESSSEDEEEPKKVERCFSSF